MHRCAGTQLLPSQLQTSFARLRELDAEAERLQTQGAAAVEARLLQLVQVRASYTAAANWLQGTPASHGSLLVSARMVGACNSWHSSGNRQARRERLGLWRLSH